MPEYDIFLSYNKADQELVELIVHRLGEDAELVPFLDHWHLIPGEPWQEALEEALEQSATVAVFIGPSGVSPWHTSATELGRAVGRAAYVLGGGEGASDFAAAQAARASAGRRAGPGGDFWLVADCWRAIAAFLGNKGSASGRRAR